MKTTRMKKNFPIHRRIISAVQLINYLALESICGGSVKVLFRLRCAIFIRLIGIYVIKYAGR